MRSLYSAALLALAACASSQTTGGLAAPVTTTTTVAIPVEGVNRLVTVHNEADQVLGYAIAGAPAVAWPALEALYSNLGLSITEMDPSTHLIGGQRLRSRSSFMGHALMNYFDCGSTADVPNVSRYDVDMSVTTQLSPATGDSTLVQTVVKAYAKPSGTAGDPIRCEVNERIAKEIAGTVANAVKGGSLAPK